MILQSNTDYGKKLKESILKTELIFEEEFSFENYFEKRNNFDNFLSMPLEKWMFIPCDSDGNILEEPYYFKDFLFNYFDNISEFDKIKCEKFQQAKANVIFEGFEYDRSEEGLTYLKKSNVSIIFDEENKTVMYVDDFVTENIETIEDLIRYKPTITPEAVKKYNL